MIMQHSIMIPDAIWKWAQAKTGLKMPSNFCREHLYVAMIRDIENGGDQTETRAAVEDLESRWKVLGCDIDAFDSVFTTARQHFIEAHGSELTAIEFLSKSMAERGMRSPRAFIVNWHKNTGD